MIMVYIKGFKQFITLCHKFSIHQLKYERCTPKNWSVYYDVYVTNKRDMCILEYLSYCYNRNKHNKSYIRPLWVFNGELSNV